MQERAINKIRVVLEGFLPDPCYHYPMRTETLHGVSIPKIGFGTWTVGGGSTPDPARDDFYLAALESALALGYTHFDTAESYAAGHAEELLGQALRAAGAPRERLFLTSKVSPEHLAHDDVLRACEASLRRLGVDFLDLYLIHWPRPGMNLPEAFRALNRLAREGRVRFLGVSNFNRKLLAQAAALSETPLLTDQVSYSLQDRRCLADGLLDYCRQNDILLTAYTPLNHRYVQGNSSVRALQDIARERGITRAQAALAWLVTQPRVIAIPMSANPQHQSENLAAGELVLTEEEMARIG